MVTIAGQLHFEGGATEKVIYRVPDDRWLVVTDARTSGLPFQLGRLLLLENLGGVITEKRWLVDSYGSADGYFFPTASGASGIGASFASGSNVVAKRIGTVVNFTCDVIGYLVPVSAPALANPRTWPPHPRDMVTIGGVFNIQNTEQVIYTVPRGCSLVVTDARSEGGIDLRLQEYLGGSYTPKRWLLDRLDYIHVPPASSGAAGIGASFASESSVVLTNEVPFVLPLGVAYELIGYLSRP